MEAVAVAFSSKIFEPGLNRIVTLDPSVELHQLNAEALRRIREHIAAEEQRGGRSARFRSVLVATTDEQSFVLRLYKAVWEALKLPGVEFIVVSTEAAAWEWLERPPET